MKGRLHLLICCLLFVVVSLQGQTVITKSMYETRPEDDDAYYFIPEKYVFKLGESDVSDALQRAINQVKTEKNFGVLFIPEGKYRISKTIYIPPAIRLIGYGKRRPEFILTKNSPGFQNENPMIGGGERYNYMFWFTGNLVTDDQQPRDANAGTFYSAISNINFTIEDGNPCAIALRAHFAQHGFVSHSIINAGKGKAGMYDVGNEMENLLFIGGEYGVMANRTSPGWPMMMVDIMFEGQRSAAIVANHADLTIMNMEVKNTPIAIDMEQGVPNRIYLEEGNLTNVDKGVVVGVDYNATNQLNIVNTYCSNVRIAVDFPNGDDVVGLNHGNYHILNITSGLIMDDLNDNSNYKTVCDIVPSQKSSNTFDKKIPLLPPVTDWTNIKDLGAKGDGTTDDTEIIQNAINTHRNIYFPTGWYRITKTLKMSPGTNLIGFHPFATQLVIDESTPAFSGFGSPVPMVESSESNNIINGIGVSTGGYNYRAVGIKWMADKNSFMNDIKFVGGHGTMRKPNLNTIGQQQGWSSENSRLRISSPTNPIATQGLDLAWDNQYWSLWVTNGGGGVFKDIWTASTYASAGLYVSNTSTPGYIYAMSLEHHVRYECRLDNVSNWKFYAFQFEEESREGKDCQPMEINKCNDLMFANMWFYRVIRVNTPRPYGIKIADSYNIDFRNMRNWTQVLYLTELPVYDMNKDLSIYPLDFARAVVTGKETGKQHENEIGIAEKLAFGFEFPTGAVADSKGNVYFCENRLKKIYKYDAKTGSVSLYSDYPWKPFSLAVDTHDNLIVICRYDPQPGYLIDGKQEAFTTPLPDDNPMYSGWGNSGWVALAYSIDPDKPDNMQVLPKVKTSEVSYVKLVIYPTHRWRSDFDVVAKSMPETSFLAPDGVTIIPETYDLGRSVQLMAVTPSQQAPVYMSHEDLKVTAKLNVDDKGKLSIIHKDIKRGEYASTTAADGTLYLAEGQIFVFDSYGKEIRRFNVHGRPISMILGGENENTLFYTTGTSFYRMRIK
ncbi:MAG: gluconolaconase [Porphyromonadaceae bacterium]|nr:gluconolaconase [Porphyromonadaceae bacterium]